MSWFCQAMPKAMLLMTSLVATTVVEVAVADVMVLVLGGTVIACVNVALVAGLAVQSQRPSPALSTTAASAAAAPPGTFSTHVAGGPFWAVVPKFPAVTRFEVLVLGVTTMVGPELRSTMGAEAKIALMVRVSVSVNAPPVPVLPKSLVNIVNVTVPPAVAV